MTGLSGRMQFRISGGSALCDAVRSRGFESFEHLAEHVRKLPYGRTANTEDPLAVLRQGRGTCSAKHQLLAAVARDCGHSEVQLTVGIYEMSEENTPGVGEVLNAASLTSIPEVHCYLSIEGERFDFTGLAALSNTYSYVDMTAENPCFCFCLADLARAMSPAKRNLAAVSNMISSWRKWSLE
jgi:hypothetical protein